MNILGNKTDGAQKKGLHAKVGSYVDGTGKLAMALLLAGALSGCGDSRESFKDGFNNFGNAGSRIVNAGGDAVGSVSNLATGKVGDSGAKLGDAAGNVVGAAVHGVVGVVDMGIGLVKGGYEAVSK